MADYDDFEDNDYTNNPTWTIHSGTGTVATSVASKRHGTYGLEMSNIAADLVNLDTPVSHATLDSWAYIKVADITALVATSYGFDSAGGIVGIIGIRSSKFAWYDSTGYHDFTALPSNNTWYILRIAYDGTNTNFYVYDDSYALIESQLGKTPPATGTVNEIRLNSQNHAGSAYYDDVGYNDRPAPSPPATGQHMAMRKLW